jgi:hypothetical protein
LKRIASLQRAINEIDSIVRQSRGTIASTVEAIAWLDRLQGRHSSN